MPVSDFLPRTAKWKARVVTSDPETNRIEVVLGDGAIRQVNPNGTLAAARWPKEEEVWTVYQQNSGWVLGERWEDDTEEFTQQHLSPGDLRLDSEFVFDAKGDQVMVMEPSGPLGLGPLTVTPPGAIPAWDPVARRFVLSTSIPSGTSVAAADITGQLVDAQLAGIGSGKLIGTLTDAQIAAIGAAKITGQIIGTQITDGAISTPKIATGAITANLIAAGTITAAQIAADSITATEIAANAITTSELAANSVTAIKILANTITATQIATDTITANEIAANAISTSELAANSVTAGKILANTITAAQIAANTITASQIAANTITAGQILANTITAGQIATDTITATQIAASAITTSELAANSVDATKIVANTITAGQIAANTITAGQIAANTITATQIFGDTITANEIAANAITTSELAALSVTAGKIVSNTITATQIAANTITAGQIAATTITATQIAANTITAGQIAAGTITGTQIAGATIAGGNIAATTITATNIATGTITADRLNITSLSAITADLGTISAGTITGATFQTATSGSRVVMDTAGLRGYALDGVTKVFEINSGSGVASFTGIATIAPGSAVPSTAITGQLTDAQLAAIAAAKVTGTLTDSQLSAIAAAKVTGTLTDAQLAAISAAKVTGTLTDAQLAGISSTKLIGSVVAAQISSVAASVVTGQLTDTQLAAIAAAKVTGTLTDSQLAAISAAKVTGQLVDSQLAALAAGKITGFIGGGNLVVDSSFESTDPALPNSLWVPGSASVTQVKSSTQAFHGTKSLAVTYASGTDPFTRIQITDAATLNSIRGRPVVASAWIYKPSTVGATVAGTTTRGIFFYDGTTQIASDISTVPTNTWTRMVVKLTPQVSTTTLELRLYNPYATGAIFYDGIQIEVGDVATGYAPRPDEILYGQIVANNIAAGAITAAAITAGSITTTEIAANTILAADIAAGTITGTEIAAATITGGKLVANTITAGQIQALTITGAEIAATTIAAGKLVANTITAAQIAANTITAAQIFGDTITASEIAANAITTTELAALSVTAAKIVANTITAGQIAAATITGTQIAATTIAAGNIVADTITSAQIAASAITASELAVNSVTAASILAGTITATEIAATTITGGKIAATTIAAGNIVANTLTTGQIQAAGVNADRLVANSITATQIGANVITAAQILSGTITTTQIAATTILAGNIATGTITAGQIAAGTITTSLMTANTINGDRITANTLDAGKITANTITASQIAATTITATQIAANTITAAQIAADTITAGQIAANAITTVELAAGAIDGKLITGATIQTSTAVNQNKIILDSAGLRAYGTILSAPVLSADTPSTLGGQGNLTSSTAYFYVVTAQNAQGETLKSNEITITSSASANPANFIMWPAIPGATSYKVYRGTATTAENIHFGNFIPTLNSGTIHFTDAFSSGTAGTPPVSNTAITIPLNVSTANDGIITGATIQNNNNVNVGKIEIDNVGFRAWGPSLVGPPISSAISAATGGTFAAGTYYHSITALNSFGESIAGTLTSGVTLVASGTVTLTWSRVNNATSYRVYRGVAGSRTMSTYFTVASTGASTQSFLDTGAAGTAGTPPLVGSAYQKTVDINTSTGVSTLTGVNLQSSANDPRVGFGAGGLYATDATGTVITSINADGTGTFSGHITAKGIDLQSRNPPGPIGVVTDNAMVWRRTNDAGVIAYIMADDSQSVGTPSFVAASLWDLVQTPSQDHYSYIKKAINNSSHTANVVVGVQVPGSAIPEKVLLSEDGKSNWIQTGNSGVFGAKIYGPYTIAAGGAIASGTDAVAGSGISGLPTNATNYYPLGHLTDGFFSALASWRKGTQNIGAGTLGIVIGNPSANNSVAAGWSGIVIVTF